MKKFAPIFTVGLLAFSIFVGLMVGATKIDGFWSALINPGSNEILWQIRIPRVVAAIVVGTALAIAGLMAQGACNNALAEPAILGTSAGASFGAILGIFMGVVQVGSLGAVAFAVTGALLSTALTFKLASLGRALSSFALIIVGIAVSALLTSLVALLSAMIDRADARSISFWSFGSLALITPENLIGIFLTTVIGISIAWKIAPSLDRLCLGDATAFHLGVDVRRIRLLALISLALLAGGAVSTVGNIAFIGLAAPHIARFIYGPAHKFLILQTGIIGSFIVVTADSLARTIVQPNELSIGLLTSLVGAPVLIALVTIKNNIWKMP